MSNLAQLPQPLFTLSVLSGPDKGSVYRINSKAITLGRDEKNDIVVNDDPRCSRSHARIVFTERGPYIISLNEKNPVVINGQETPQALLKPNSEILLGGTRFRFQFQGEDSTDVVANPMAGVPAIPGSTVETPKKKKRKLPAPDNKKSIFRLFIGLILIGMVYAIIASNNKLKTTEINFDEKADVLIKDNKEKIRTMEENKRKAGEDTAEYREAQIHYLRGFRDFRHGQYERAMTSFQACLSLFPAHQLCRRYLSLANRKVDEIINYNMVLGRRYKDQNQFQPCLSAFTSVMVMVQDQTKKIYEEAKSNYEYCQRRLEEGLY